MKYTPVSLFIGFTVIFLVFITCYTEENICQDDLAFCEFVYDNNLEGTHSLINSFLAIAEGDMEDQLAQLEEWLDCKSCIEQVEILCNS